jgi:PAS domain S-box-containing protein
MNLKKTFTISLAVIIVLLIFLSGFTLLMFSNKAQSERKYENQIKSIAIATALRASSDDLTRFVRTYAVTGDSVWEKRYWHVLAIRNGEKPWPNGRIISLHDTMLKLGFTKIEFNKLKEAEKNSNGLVSIEEIAFHAMKGLFIDKNGNFTKKGKPDQKLARRVLFDKRYHDYKATIMKPIDEFIILIHKRVAKDIRNYNTYNYYYLIAINIFVILIILVTILSFFKIKHRIIVQMNALEKSEKNYRDLFDSADPILTIKNGVFTNCNKATVNLLKYKTKKEFLNTHPSKLSPKYQPDGLSSIEKAEKMIQKALKKGTHRFEWTHKKRTKENLQVEVLLKTILNKPNNQIIHAVWRDITKRKIAEKELTETNKDLKELVYIASHDLQVPLVSMEGYTSELLSEHKENLNENSLYCLKRLQSNSQRMHKLVLSLLDLSRLNTHTNPYEEIDTNKLIENILRDLSLTVEDEKAQINCKILPNIFADKQRIDSVFRNLIQNALKYEGKHIEIGFKKGFFYIKDDGIGIPKDQLERIFKAGERLKMNKAEGVGMGLAFCKKSINLHKSEIWAESNGLNKGATFKIKFNRTTLKY